MQKDTKLLNNNNIFIKNINNKSKLIPLNIINNYVGEAKYFPSEFKEWNNNVYYFNSNYLKNIPLYNINLNRLIKFYFDFYLNPLKFKSNFIDKKKSYYSLNKIFVSKAELKHTNSKVIITVYVYNRERIILLNKIRKIKKSLFIINNFFYKCINTSTDLYNIYLKKILYKEFIFLNKWKLKLNLNDLRFKNNFLFRLNKFISKIYKKKIEFNIINLKSIVHHPDIYTDIMQRKLRKQNTNVLRLIKTFLNKGHILENNDLKERFRVIKSVNFNLLENKYKNININSIVENTNLNKTIVDSYDVKNSNNKDIIFESIKYKNLGGIRLELKGRLTRKFKSEKAMFKIKWKGGLKNIDSSFKGLSSVNYRGNVNSNLEYSLNRSKRRIGAFAIKGWISGK
uniref:Ribosomal protein 3 n=1 Tax=Graphilbum nigrum TaxID=91033 RepID=C7SWF0_9PEZI|nr:ribosomal protein 3 [Graphilbum nigrum]